MTPTRIEVSPRLFGESVIVDQRREEILIHLVIFGRRALPLRRIPFGHIVRLAPFRVDGELHPGAAAFSGSGCLLAVAMGWGQLARLFFFENKTVNSEEGYIYDLMITTKDGHTFPIARATGAWDREDADNEPIEGMAFLEQRLRKMIRLPEFY